MPVAKKPNEVEKVEIILPSTPAKFSSFSRAAEVQDHLLATDVVNRYVKSEVDNAKNKMAEEAKKKMEKDASGFLLRILLILVISPIIFAIEWAIVTTIYAAIFK